MSEPYDDFINNYLKFEKKLLLNQSVDDSIDTQKYINSLGVCFKTYVDSINDVELGGIERHASISKSAKGLCLKCSNYRCYYDNNRKRLSVLVIMPQFEEIKVVITKI